MRILLICLLAMLGLSLNAAAQDFSNPEDSIAIAQADELELPVEEDPSQGLHNTIKGKFIEGDWRFMTPILLCFIFGLAIVIQRVLILNLKTINTRKFLRGLDQYLAEGDMDKTEKLITRTRGPLAAIFYQAFRRRHEGIDIVEKTIVSHGSVQMNLLERGLVWIALFISVGPMLGFLGTVVGMVFAFDDIEAAGELSPAVVASGIKVALLTTVAGLIVAIILQVFYNYLLSKIDRMVHDMEDASIEFVDMLLRHNASSR